MSRHHAAVNWARLSRKLRPRIAAALPAPCIQCGRDVSATEPWDIGHRVDLADGGDLRDYGPAHRSCNRAAGGRRGAAITNARRYGTRTEPRLPDW